MSIHTVPTNVFTSQIVTLDQKHITITSKLLTRLALYLYIELGLRWLKQGPFIFVFANEDATIGIHSYAFRGHLPCGRRLAIALSDDAYTEACDLPARLNDFQDCLPPPLVDAVVLLTARVLDYRHDLSISPI